MGRIAAPYGVKGWVKILPLTSEPQTLLGYPQWWVRRRGGEGAWQAHTLESGRQHGATLLAQLSGLADREAAAVLAGGDVGVPRSALPPAKENEYYWADLVGLSVVNREGVVLGRVAAVEDFGAHPVLRVDAEGSAGTPMRIPFVDAYVDGVDIAASRIEVDWQPDY
jgi:16S rRNA processing protein RimM